MSADSCVFNSERRLWFPISSCQNLSAQHDDLLIPQAESGDQRAFVELCRRYNKPLMRTIFRIVRNHDDAEDIVQDTMLSAYEHLNGFRGQSSFSTWIIRIGINKALMLLRKRKMHPEVTFDSVSSDSSAFETREHRDPSPNPEECYAARQTYRLVWQAVTRLRTDLRCIVERHLTDESSIAELADALGITPSAAKSRLMRARRSLRSSLQKHKMSCPGRVARTEPGSEYGN